MNSHEAEMHTAIHDILAERDALRSRVADLEVELHVAREMVRNSMNVDVRMPAVAHTVATAVAAR